MPTNFIIGGLADAQEDSETNSFDNKIGSRLFNLIDNPFKDLLYQQGGTAFVADWISIEKTSNYALKLVDSTNIILFNYLDQEQKKAKRRALLMAYYYLYAQWELHRLYGRRYLMQPYEAALNQCATQINRLSLLLDDIKPAPAVEYSLKIETVENHSLVIRDLLNDLIHGKITFAIKSLIRMINDRRLYWVWAGDTIGILLDLFESLGLIQQSSKGLDHTRRSLAKISHVSRYMSFILYYLRFSLDALIFLLHVIDNRWMTDEERALKASTWDKLVYHGKKRIFSLINDALWATANLISFMILFGSKAKDHAGDFLTLGLLVMDFCLLIWQYLIELQRHSDYINQLLNERGATQDPAEIARLDQMISDAEMEWKYQQFHMLNNLGYALLLIFSYSLICIYHFEKEKLLIMGVVGTAICFSLNLINVLIRGWLEIKKIKETRAAIEAQIENLLSEFYNAADDSNLQKQLFLQIKELKATSAHQYQEISYQQIELIRATLFDVIFPSVVMVSLLFLPTGAGIGVIAAVMVLGLLSNLLMTKIIQPYLYGEGTEASLEFDEEEFNTFKQEPSLGILASKHGFFSPNSDDFNSEEEEGLDEVLMQPA